ncbi:MAG: calcium/proton exchanger [Thermoanaerobaculaceae bacterium]|nr:calcium/proton exchanger [Thermoanaerobaculaceae bacterium]
MTFPRGLDARSLLRALPWLLLPAAMASAPLHAPAPLRFALGGAALVPLAGVLGVATEQLAARLGPVAAGLLNATCGNAAELIIAILALRRGLVAVVQASLSGSIIANLLLVLGAALLAGGLRRPVQRFSALAAESQLGSLALAVFALLLPAVFFHLASLAHREELAWPLSLGVAVVLLAVYAAALLFSLRTHRHLVGAGEGGRTLTWSTRRAVVVLLFAGGATAAASEVLVGSVEETAHALSLGPVFLGVVVVAMLGNAAEHAAAVFLAWREQMDAAISVCLASSLQVALFVTPVLVLLSLPLGHPMTLVFSAVEVMAVAMAVALAGLVILNGESNWLEGVQLLALYVILAVCLALLPPGEALRPF